MTKYIIIYNDKYFNVIDFSFSINIKILKKYYDNL